MAIDITKTPEADGITEGQMEAIVEAMRIIVEEDRERGVDRQARFICPACSRSRQMLGSVLYDDVRLCNACATGFEVARVRHVADSAREFVRSQLC